MAIVRWEPFCRSLSPFEGFETLRRRMDRLFDEFGRGEEGDVLQSRWIPSVDVTEAGDQYLIHAEIPGMSKKDIKITLEGDVLTIAGEKKLDREKKDRTYHLVERAYGQFSRSFTLPHKVDGENIKASFKDGVLEITVPKAPEAKSREIEIKVG